MTRQARANHFVKRVVRASVAVENGVGWKGGEEFQFIDAVWLLASLSGEERVRRTSVCVCARFASLFPGEASRKGERMVAVIRRFTFFSGHDGFRCIRDRSLFGRWARMGCREGRDPVGSRGQKEKEMEIISTAPA